MAHVYGSGLFERLAVVSVGGIVGSVDDDLVLFSSGGARDTGEGQGDRTVRGG